MATAGTTHRPFRIATIISALGLIAAVAGARAGDMEVAVNGPGGDPVADAVVVVTALDFGAAESAGRETPDQVVIAQEDRQFVPLVTAIDVGTRVAFPNHDNILHNVYSFSEAKKFQLPLYKDEPPEPVVFDRPGVAILGCNIHDWMVAYVYVLETPYFSKTGDDGLALLRGIPAGSYEVEVRHPRKRKSGSTPPRRIAVSESNTVNLEFAIALKPQWRPQRKP